MTEVQWRGTQTRNCATEVLVRPSFCRGSALVPSLAKPGRIRIETAPNRQYDLSHACAGKNAPFLIEQRPLRENLHVMPLHKGRSRQTGFAGSNFDDRRSYRPFTAERNNQ